ncbi:uncharacterized protein CELE_F20A1.8 [Caenorhabditis elegans]|uniref:Secreted protein n=1 Tax=Caenorhabditis elegans TaxID=6239 RepID=Q19613_CAEEL|nr:Secreted protein [Caenorhabditis elegans]CCD66546.1 Secreted protein [Caenorhabditis elegans]|eukprot:NP_504785.1 Uncharacterized protein CELE_F20A1.8 [Caenorhabditis elegans]
MRLLLVLLFFITPLHALFDYPSPTFPVDRYKNERMEHVRGKRYYIITEHAEQVKKAAAEYKDFKEKQDEKEAPKIRTKRDWFATLTPEQVQERYTLLNYTIKKKHH